MSDAFPMLRRMAAMIVFAGSFIVMASVFAPEPTEAENAPPPVVPAQPAAATRPSGPVPAPKEAVDSPISTNPHEGLRSLGTLQGARITIHIYATDVGARYSLYETVGGRELGVLLTPEQVSRGFPEVQLPTTDFSAPNSDVLMLAEPPSTVWIE